MRSPNTLGGIVIAWTAHGQERYQERSRLLTSTELQSRHGAEWQFRWLCRRRGSEIGGSMQGIYCLGRAWVCQKTQ